MTLLANKNTSWLLSIVILAAVYFLFGRLGLLLAVPPGYATVIWPSSGIALAAVLLFGYRIWPGILLGSVLINISVAYFDADFSLLWSLVISSSIGLGAALQALLAACLIKRFVEFPNSFIELKQIIGFFLLGGPLACFVSATIGMSSLYWAGKVELGSFVINWGTWWVGDVIGVLIFTPLCLIWSRQSVGFNWQRKMQVTVALVLFFVIAIIVFGYSVSLESDRRQQEFHTRSNEIQREIEVKLHGYIDILYALSGFHTSSHYIDRDEFRRFSQGFLSHHPSIQAIEWVPRITNDQRADFENQLVEEGFIGASISENSKGNGLVIAAVRDEYFPVKYVEPYLGNEDALAYDIASDAVRKQALVLARESKKIVATGKVTLVQEKHSAAGILVFSPIYKNRIDPLSVSESDVLLGYMIVAFRVKDTMSAILSSSLYQELDVSIDDLSSTEHNKSIFKTNLLVNSLRYNWFNSPDNYWQGELQFASRQWQISIKPTPVFLIKNADFSSWWVLASGLLFTSLLGVLTLISTGRQVLFEQLLAERTEQLVRVNADLFASEERVQAALDAAQAGVFSYDIKDDILFWDVRTKQIFGMSDETLEVSHQHWMSLLHPDDKVSTIDKFNQFLAEQKIFELDYRIITEDNLVRFINVKAKKICDAGGQPIRVQGLYRDITKNKEMENETEKLYRQLQLVQKMETIGQLTGGIAHDFNNILASILGYTSLALTKFGTDKEGKLHEYLSQVARSGERAKELVQQMLMFGRGGADQPVLIKPNIMLIEVVKMIQPLIPSTIKLKKDIADNLPDIFIDPIQFHQVLMNLFINARDAMGSKGIIKVGMKVSSISDKYCSACSSEIVGNFIEVSIHDDGEGVAPELAGRIFDPFFTTKDVGKGTGMGLSVVHGIVHDHHGHIIVESDIGKGSEFRILFPIVKSKGTLKNDQILISLDEHKKNSGHILIVDDEVSITRFMTELLKVHNYRVTTFNDPGLALEYFTKCFSDIDVVITDQTMPGMMGVELVEKMLSINIEQSIIMCTGYSDSADKERASAIGIKAFYLKPIEINSLLTCIQKLLSENDMPGKLANVSKK